MAHIETPAKVDQASPLEGLNSLDSPDFAIKEIERRAQTNCHNIISTSTPTPVFGRTTQLMSQAKSRAAAAAVVTHGEHETSQGLDRTEIQRYRPTNPFIQRTKRPEHHTDSRVYAPKIAAYSHRPAAPLQEFSSDLGKPIQTIFFSQSKRATTICGLNDEDFYTDPQKASADLKALLEGSIEEDDDSEDSSNEYDEYHIGQDDHNMLILDNSALSHSVHTNIETLTVANMPQTNIVSQKPLFPPRVGVAGTNGIAEFLQLSKNGTVEGLKVKLLPHQVEGVQWMRGRELGPVKRGRVPKGGILADDMGLGKTLQAMSLILCNKKPTQGDRGYKKQFDNIVPATLIVAPLALIRQWETEINEKITRSHKLRVCVHHGPNRTKRFSDLADFDIVITTYQILVSEFSQSMKENNTSNVGCFGLHWWRVVLDEAHTIKNRTAKATKACYAIKSEYRWCLTGTPMQNNLDELQSLIKFLNIPPYDKLGEWRDQIDKPMKNGHGHVALNRLHSVLRCFMKRRTKDILRQYGALYPGGLPPAPGEPLNADFKVTERKIITIQAELSTTERELYMRLEARAGNSIRAMMKDKVDYVNAFTLLLRLRQACVHPELLRKKVDADAYIDIMHLGGYPEIPKHSAKKQAASKSGGMDTVSNLFADMDLVIRLCCVCRRSLEPDNPETCFDCSQDLEYFEKEESIQANSLESKTQVWMAKNERTMTSMNRNSTPRRYRIKKHTINADDKLDDAEICLERERGSSNLFPEKASNEEYEERRWVGVKDCIYKSSDDEGGYYLKGVVKHNGLTQSLSPNHSDIDDNPLPIDIKPVLIGGRNKKDCTVSKLHPRGKIKNASVDHDKKHDNKICDKIFSELSQMGAKDGDEPDGYNHLDGHFPNLNGRPIMPSSKIRHLLDIIKMDIDRHKFIVFSEFTSMMDIIELFFDRAKIYYARYDGKMRSDEREASLNRLRSDSKCRVLLCSLKCGSLGLNLTAATRVIILEPFWNPFIEEQAIDRVHRLTQTVDVVVYKIIMKNTVEERILQLQESKRLLARQAIEGSVGVAANKLGLKELMMLFHSDDDNSHELMVSLSKGKRRLINSSQAGYIMPRTLAIGGGIGNSKECQIYGRRW